MNLIKSGIKLCAKQIYNSLEFTLYISRIIFSGSLKNPLKKECNGTIAVLANGPSLKYTLQRIREKKEEFKDIDFIVLNYFAYEDLFKTIKPKHYCFADPMFFGNSHRVNEVKKLFKILQHEVTWNMNIYIPHNKKKDFQKFSKINNPYINLIGINNLCYHGFQQWKNFFFKKGLAIPTIYTVAILAIFVSINKGYKKINLYGVDHTFFESLCINENNELCNLDHHFYDKGKTELKPIRRNDNGEIWKISEYLQSITNMFKGHDELAQYAQYTHTKIVNCTTGSMIDSYERECNLSLKIT